MNNREQLVNLFDKIAVLFNFTAEEVGKAHKANTTRLKRILSSALKQLSEKELRNFTDDEITFMQNELGLETRNSILNNQLTPTIEDSIAEIILLQNAMSFTIETILNKLMKRYEITDAIRRDVRAALDLLASRRVGAVITKDGYTYTLNLTNQI
jgi:DNA-binding TFAR19-related protein (PDSD5 family)